MTSSVGNNLKVPYEIGRFIQSLKPANDVRWSLWTHKEVFEHGPNPLFNQMKQGYILKVNHIHWHLPQSIYTRFGEWFLFCASEGINDQAFDTIKAKLRLRKIKEISCPTLTFWAITHWEGQNLDRPIRADESKGENLPFKEANQAYKDFVAGL
jgi:hypothetical protein